MGGCFVVGRAALFPRCFNFFQPNQTHTRTHTLTNTVRLLSACSQGFSLRGLTLKVAVPGIDAGALLSFSQQHAAPPDASSSPAMALRGQLREVRSAGLAAVQQNPQRWRRQQRTQTINGEEALEVALAAAGIYFQFFAGAGGAALPLPLKALLTPVLALEKYLTQSVAGSVVAR